jgi:hypothetical protein
MKLRCKAIASLLFFAVIFCAGNRSTLADPVDSGSPDPIPGKVTEGANFTFASDAAESPQPSINHWICNKDDKGLIFVWEKARLARGMFHPLPPGECQEDPHAVPGIQKEPDYEAPILYTQSSLRRTAAVYKDTAAQGAQVQSIFRTKLANSDGENQNVEVQITYQLESDKALNVFITSAQWFGFANAVLAPFEDIRTDASSKGVEVIQKEAFGILKPEDLSWLTPSFHKDSVFLMQGVGLKTFGFAIPLQSEIAKTMRIKPSTLFVLDSSGNLIGTGSYSQIAPE